MVKDGDRPLEDNTTSRVVAELPSPEELSGPEEEVSPEEENLTKVQSKENPEWHPSPKTWTESIVGSANNWDTGRKTAQKRRRPGTLSGPIKIESKETVTTMEKMIG